MLDKDEIYKQNMNDMNRIATVLSEILKEKELTPDDDRRINYCTKLMRDVREKQKIVKNFK